jgi:hypothetical protein
VSERPREPRIFRYVLRVDAGTAPNPFGNWCTLAICKPRIRQQAMLGDWIIGLMGGAPSRVVYVMEVTERLSFGEYWKDQRFKAKRPRNNPFGDNIYRPSGCELVQVKNKAHGQDAYRRDTGGRWVLASERFWCFGSQAPELPKGLSHLIHRHIGHAVQSNRKPSDLRVLRRWLLRRPRGMQGLPSHAIGPIPLATGVSQRC